MPRQLVVFFSLAPEQVAGARALSALRRRTKGRALTRPVVSVWHDTAARTLFSGDVLLRVERFGHKRVQTAFRQTVGLVPALGQDVFEGPVPTDDPSVGAIDNLGIAKVLEQAAGMPLVPVFEVEATRTTRNLDLGEGCMATARLDVGRMRVDRREIPVQWLEIRLLRGPPAVLFDLVREIGEELGVWPEGRDPAMQGLEFADALPPAWAKRRPLTLSGSETVEEAMALMLGYGLDHVAGNAAAVVHNDHPEGIHQMRVGLRRTRSALRLFRQALPPQQYEWLTGEIRWLTGELGPARDMDVFEDEIMAPVLAHCPDPDAMAGLVKRVRRERLCCREAARDAVRSERYHRLMLDAGTWIATRPWRDVIAEEAAARMAEPIAELACRLVAKRHNRVRKDGGHFDALSTPERHQLRIDLKKLRYAIDFFGSLYPAKRVERYLERLSGLQDGLGYLNDVSVARQLVDRICKQTRGDNRDDCRYAGGMVVGWHAHALARIEDGLSGEVASMLRARPFWKTK